MKKSTTPKVTLRYEQKTGSTVQNLYLDFYPPITDQETGKTTRREFLHLHVTPLQTASGDFRTAKTGAFQIARTGRYFVYSNDDTETIRTAQIYAQQRQRDMFCAELLDETEQQELITRRKSETPVLEYFMTCANNRAIANNSRRMWHISHLKFSQYLQSIGAENIRLKDIDKTFCDRYLQYLQTPTMGRWGYNLKHNTIVTYYSKFVAVLHDAYDNGYISKIPQMQSICMKDTGRVFLEMNELEKLAQTPCNNNCVKRAALFSALTGLRYSDIKQLRWGNISNTETGIEISITMQKTDQHLLLPISADALALCGERKNNTDLVFADMIEQRSCVLWYITQWAKAAGIEKHISFHTFRHTYATLQLSNGTDITTIQQLMGHKSLATTQIYAKVLDSAKRAAADRIKLNVEL